MGTDDTTERGKATLLLEASKQEREERIAREQREADERKAEAERDAVRDERDREALLTMNRRLWLAVLLLIGVLAAVVGVGVSVDLPDGTAIGVAPEASEAGDIAGPEALP